MQDWQEYEQQIYEKFSSKYENCEFKKNYYIQGIYSKSNRQIDVAIIGEIAGFKQLGIIECKCYNNKIDVKTIDSFIGLMQDVNATFGVIITTIGFTEGAENRAKNQNIHLDIVELNKLEDYEFYPDTDTCHMCDDNYRNVVHWDRYDVEDAFDVGHCAYCNETHIRCKKCGGITSISETNQDGIIECLGGCGLKIKHNYDECHDEHFEIIEKSNL